MDIRFDGKLIIVTGGSSGIGKSTVKQFLESGGNVVFTGIEDSKSIDLKEFSGTGEGFYEYYRLDGSKEADVKEFADYVYSKYGNCDVLFNNAGIIFANILHETPTEEWMKIMDVNLNAIYFASKYFIPQMLKKGGGAIVNTSSISGLQSDYALCAYNASKGAVANLTRSMALDYAKYNIRVNAVAPGVIRTPMYYNGASAAASLEVFELGMSMVYPIGRIGLPEEVANAVLFLASDKATNITGINLLIDGGLTAHTGSQKNWDMVETVYNCSKKTKK
jgi:meso-butanediol dehydrogenase/(S,S)-butanediol dehydrogenase/diacetyl reductase